MACVDVITWAGSPKSGALLVVAIEVWLLASWSDEEQVFLGRWWSFMDDVDG